MTCGLMIISGGQTGVDRGALDAALELGSTCGGWCPEGRRAEDGRIPVRYPLRELIGGAYADRTRRNVEDAEGTLILHLGPVSGGTQLTLETCRRLGKPVLLLDAATVSSEDGAAQACSFVAAHDIRRLNVAGPRESFWAGAQAFACAVVRTLLLRYTPRA
jgi:hypothetical protein